MGKHKQHDHHHRRNGQHFAQHRDFVHRLVVVDVGRKDDGDGTSRNAHQKHQIGIVQAIMNLAGQAGHDQAFGVL